MAFLKGSSDPKDRMPGCATYDHHGGVCLLDRPCLVEQRERCQHFERAVLPTAADIGQLQNITFAYERHIGKRVDIKVSNEVVKDDRICPACKTALLPPRRRLCNRCQKAKRRVSHRANYAASRPSRSMSDS